ncbi:response regulator [Aquimarina aggregata]|uniref:response regulator n=1 Tax=Aquimarina aggregata TaxID=1642818 RepID=UPI00249019B4|nr:response regulator [Aquimarina aggregata]
MKNPLKHILLVDDSPATNFFNETVIKKCDLTQNISVALNGAEALTFFDETKSTLSTPEIIFLDINMPIMNGWEFLDNYKKLNIENSIVILMIGSNLQPNDKEKLKNYHFIKGDSQKMLNKEFLYNIVNEHFDL